MTAKYYANAMGQYLGAYDGAPPPPGGIPIPYPPRSALAMWNGSGWSEPAAEVPKEVSRRRGLEALFRQHGITLQDIKDKIAQVITDPDEQYLALNDLETSQTFERHRDRVIQIGAAFGLDLDALFIYAANLP